LGAREAALVGVEICRALAVVHEAGLVHRDVKTVNVMREESGRVVLLDFGLAVRANAPLEEHAAGTPPCMAPETLRGERATALSDLYSLGVLLYRLVTATFPYAGRTAQEVADAQARGARVALRDARADLPAGFVSVVERALDSVPEARYAPARVAFVDLSPVTEPETIEGELRRALGAPVGDPERLAESLGVRRGLLVLDNCEHVLEVVVGRVAELLAAPRWQVLATSRSPLKVPGESVLIVPPLGLPPAGTADTAQALGSFDAVRLF